MGQNAPVSQTLIVLSQEPDTIVLPSNGLKATELIPALCAFSFVALSSRVPAEKAGGVSSGNKGDFEALAYLHPKL